MATYISYDDVVLGQNPLVYVALTDTDSAPFEDKTGNGHDVSSLNGFSKASTPMFDYAPGATLGVATVEGSSLTMDDEAGIISALNTAQEATIIGWIRPDSNYADNRVPPRIAHTSVSDTVARDSEFRWPDGNWTPIDAGMGPGTTNMVALVKDATTDHLYVDGQLIHSGTRSSGAWDDISDIMFSPVLSGSVEVNLAWISIFDRRLTLEEIQEQHQRRRFQGKVSGTMTLDGSPTADATVRSFRRSDGKLNGETTSAADGTYEITVLDQVECDLLAIPPSGVAARPLAHGPILPDPYTQ